MSIPDHEIEPPSICEQHGELMPCLICRIEWAEEQAELAIERQQLEEGI